MNVQKTSQEYDKLFRNLNPKTGQVQVVNDYKTPLNKSLKAGYTLNTKPTTIYLETSKEPSFLERIANAIKSFEVITPSIKFGSGKLYFKAGMNNFKIGWYTGF